MDGLSLILPDYEMKPFNYFLDSVLTEFHIMFPDVPVSKKMIIDRCSKRWKQKTIFYEMALEHNAEVDQTIQEDGKNRGVNQESKAPSSEREGEEMAVQHTKSVNFDKRDYGSAKKYSDQGRKFNEEQNLTKISQLGTQRFIGNSEFDNPSMSFATKIYDVDYDKPPTSYANNIYDAECEKPSTSFV